MQSTETETGGVAQEPTAEPARANESESDGERVSETGSSMARSDKEMCLVFPTTAAVTAKNWKSWSCMHQLVMCLAYAVHHDYANALFRE